MTATRANPLDLFDPDALAFCFDEPSMLERVRGRLTAYQRSIASDLADVAEAWLTGKCPARIAVQPPLVLEGVRMEGCGELVVKPFSSCTQLPDQRIVVSSIDLRVDSTDAPYPAVVLRGCSSHRGFIRYLRHIGRYPAGPDNTYMDGGGHELIPEQRLVPASRCCWLDPSPLEFDRHVLRVRHTVAEGVDAEYAYMPGNHAIVNFLRCTHIDMFVGRGFTTVVDHIRLFTENGLSDYCIGRMTWKSYEALRDNIIAYFNALPMVEQLHDFELYASFDSKSFFVEFKGAILFSAARKDSTGAFVFGPAIPPNEVFGSDVRLPLFDCLTPVESKSIGYGFMPIGRDSLALYLQKQASKRQLEKSNDKYRTHVRGNRPRFIATLLLN